MPHLRLDALINDESPGCTPINAVACQGSHLHVLWNNLQDELLVKRYQSGWRAVENVFKYLNAGAQFSVAVRNGTTLRLYYQHSDDSIQEICNDGAGWYSGSRVEQAHEASQFVGCGTSGQSISTSNAQVASIYRNHFA